MMGFGKIVLKKVTECFIMQTKLIMRENFCMINLMVMERSFSKMVLIILDSFKMDLLMGKENSSGLMGQSMKANGKIMK